MSVSAVSASAQVYAPARPPAAPAPPTPPPDNSSSQAAAVQKQQDDNQQQQAAQAVQAQSQNANQISVNFLA